MTQSLTFKDGSFIPTDYEKWNAIEEKFDKILDTVRDPHEQLAAFMDITTEEPFYFDAYAHAGLLYLRNDYIDQALTWYHRGIDKADTLIPTGYSGPISGTDYHRLHNGYAICHLHKGFYKEALQLIEQHLIICGDNKTGGLEQFLGDLYLLNGDRQKAKPALQKQLSLYTPGLYSLALIEFKEENFIQAATLLRKGFTRSPYVVEMLLGNQKPRRLFQWRGDNLGDQETAIYYLKFGGKKIWEETDQALDFLHWLYNHSEVLFERANIAKQLQGLYYERDFDKRSAYSKQYKKSQSNINDDISKKIIARYIDRDQVERWPWEHERLVSLPKFL